MIRRFAVIALLCLVGMSCFAQEKPTPTPTLPVVAAKEETKALDEVTLLKLQNGLLRIQKAQSDINVAQLEIVQANEQANRTLEKFYKANGLVQEEWALDQQRMILVRKQK